jgi:hypothetical protein
MKQSQERQTNFFELVDGQPSDEQPKITKRETEKAVDKALKTHEKE